MERNDHLIRIGSYNIASFYKEGDLTRIEKIEELMSQQKIDMAGLQEVDRFNPRSGNRDLLKIFENAGRLVHTDFNKTVLMQNAYDYGTGIVSRFAICDTARGSYRAQKGEKRGWHRITVNFAGGKLSHYNTHLDYLDQNIRRQQILELLEIVDQDTSEYKIITGDFNTDVSHEEFLPFVKNYQITNGNDNHWLETYNHKPDPTMQVYSVDQIAFSKNFSLKECGMIERPELSDHNLLWAELEF